MVKNMKQLDQEKAKKLSLMVNTGLLVFVTGMLFVFYFFHVKMLVTFSFFVVAFYLLCYPIICYKKLDIYVWLVYAMISVYMGFCTICLGYEFGFHLYCMSLIPIIFVTDYMSTKLRTRNPRPVIVSICLIVVSEVCNLYTLKKGAIYSLGKDNAVIFVLINSLSVFFFLITYSSMMISMVKESENELRGMAHQDKLTGLYNRHYILDCFEQENEQLKADFLRTHIVKSPVKDWDDLMIAMVDIDDFKKINDTHGHNYGDYVLKKVSFLMMKVCEGCILCRWGGEEFLLILPKKNSDLLEELRNEIEKESFEEDDHNTAVTISIGGAVYQNEKNLDQWIQVADEKLYQAKKNGKNRVVS